LIKKNNSILFKTANYTFMYLLLIAHFMARILLGTNITFKLD